MESDDPCWIDPGVPPAWTTFEWYRRCLLLNDVKAWHRSASTLDDGSLRDAVRAVDALWSLVDPVARWLMADGLSRENAASHRPLAADVLEASCDVIRGVREPGASREVHVAIVDLSERFFRRAGDAGTGWSLTAVTGPVRASTLSPLFERAVAVVEQDFLATAGDPQLLWVDEYQRLELQGAFAPREFLMSRRATTWYIVLWPWMAQSLVGLLPPHPSGTGGDPAGAREPSRPHTPRASGGAALDLPET